MPILTPADHRFFAEQGYLRVPEAVPAENVAAAVEAIWDFLGMDPNDPADWYRPPASAWGGVELYHAQAFWDNRQHPRMHQIFSELLGRQDLWVSIDRAAMKPPSNPAHLRYDFAGFVHWDADLTKRTDFDARPQAGVQGVLYLADTSEDMGGFQCVPGFPRKLGEWVRQQRAATPAGTEWKPDASGLAVQPIAGQAGDLVIWSVLMPHGSGRNRSSRPRLAQYLSMSPPRDEAARQERIERFDKKLPPNAAAFPGDPRGWEQRTGPAALTALGRKLLGVDPW